MSGAPLPPAPGDSAGARAVAAIDVGSHSVKLLVALREPDGAWRRAADRLVVTALGRGLRHGRLAPDAIARTTATLRDLVAEARRLGAGPIAAVGTAALRTARNAGPLRAAATELGIELEVLTGEEEGRLSFVGAVAALPAAAGRLATIFDVGGGSTEFVQGRGEPERRLSLPLGVLPLMEAHVRSDPATPRELAAMIAEADALLAPLDTWPRGELLASLGGTPTTLAAVHLGLARYDPAVIQGLRLSTAVVADLTERLRALSLAERQRLPGLEPARAGVILAGAAIILAVLRRFGAQEFLVSDHDLRHGLLRERFGAALAPSA